MKKNLILLHGALGAEMQFDSLVNNLSDHFNVYTLDFEGHGKRDSQNSFSIELFTDNLENFLNEHNLEQCCVFGYSMGGYVALNLALHKPELIGKIMTLGTKFNWSKETAEAEVNMLDPEKMEAKIPAFAARLKQLHGDKWKSVVTNTAGLMLKLGNVPLLNNNTLNGIKNDVLVTLGGKDKMVTREETEHAAKILPNGKFMLFDSFPHPLEMIDEDILGEAIINFMK